MSENKSNITALNTLKSWFKTGLKPTQSQFWAWIDSFWHKDEEIPQEKISGLSKTLENKADAEQLKHKADKTVVEKKANLDASGLSAENVISWKEALGVGDLPPNIATVDKDEELGNVHTKEQVEKLLENSGKNLGNTDLKIPEGIVRALDITGARLQFKGLEDKKADISYNQKLVADENGNLAVTTTSDISVVVPENLNIAVNNIFPSPIPDRPAFADEIKEALMGYDNIPFKKIEQNEWEVWTIHNKMDGVNIHDDSSVFVNGNHASFNGLRGGVIINLSSSVVLPRDKDWVFKITGSISAAYNGSAIYTGLSREKDANNVDFGLTTSGYSTLMIMGGKDKVNRDNFTYIVVKVGGVLFQSLYQNARNISHTTNAFVEAGDYHPKVVLNTDVMNIKAYYKILN